MCTINKITAYFVLTFCSLPLFIFLTFSIILVEEKPKLYDNTCIVVSIKPTPYNCSGEFIVNGISTQCTSVTNWQFVYTVRVLGGDKLYKACSTDNKTCLCQVTIDLEGSIDVIETGSCHRFINFIKIQPLQLEVGQTIDCWIDQDDIVYIQTDILSQRSLCTVIGIFCSLIGIIFLVTLRLRYKGKCCYPIKIREPLLLQLVNEELIVR